MERQSLYDRFKTLSWQQQLGNIASTLANVSRYAVSPAYDELTRHSLREAALEIDWCVSNVPQEFLINLATMHRELLAWWQVFPVEPRSLLALHTRHQSDCLLIMAGLMMGVDSLDVKGVVAKDLPKSIDLLQQAGLIGCAEAESDLSVNYKQYL